MTSHFEASVYDEKKRAIAGQIQRRTDGNVVQATTTRRSGRFLTERPIRIRIERPAGEKA